VSKFKTLSEAMKLLGNLKKGLVFVVSAPAGTGKTTLVKMLVEEFPCVKASVSCTTRPPRIGEIPGVDYDFISEPEFERRVAEGDLEYALVFDHYYGTSKKSVLREQERGRHVVLVIDTQGAMQIKKIFPAVYIFVRPPSMEELSKRLKNRRTEPVEKIKSRLEWAKREVEMAIYYDYQIINDDLQIAYQVLRGIVIAEEHRTESLSGEQEV
jgi:guanylate kinase